MARLNTYLTIVLLSATLTIWMGCASDDDGGGEGTPVSTDSLIAAANAELEDALYLLINSDPQEPEDIDLSAPYAAYMDVLQQSPTHPTANFGAGVLEVMMFTRDPEVQAFFDDMQAFFDAGDYFAVGGGVITNDVRVKDPILSASALKFPAFQPLTLTRRFSRVLDDDPQVSDLQAICQNEVLPRMTMAIARLERVTPEADFVFTITPRMQGDPDEDPVELDLTEVYATLGVLHATTALLDHFCAYNFDFSAYDGPGMLQAFSQGSNFATLFRDDLMSEAREQWLNAIAEVSAGITFLRNETDDQNDDLIRIDPYDGFTQDELDSVEHYLDVIENALNGSQVFELDTDGDDWTPPEQITVSLQALYLNPVTDLKALFPNYTVALDTQSAGWEWHSDYSYIPAIVDVQASGYYYWSRSAYWFHGEQTSFNEDITIAVPEWDAAWNAQAALISDQPYASLSLYFSGYLAVGTNNVSARMYYNYEEPTPARYVPRITWQAQTFEQWILPDPTLSGLFPGMTDSRFKELFGITGEDWERTTTWDLW